MQKVLMCLALAVVGSLAVAGGRNLTNPFTSDADGGGFSIYNIVSYIGHELAITNAQNSVMVGATPMGNRGRVMLGDGGYPFFGYPSITAHTADPSVVGVDLDTGSLLMRRVDAAHGELWFKTGPLATDWVRIAGQ